MNIVGSIFNLHKCEANTCYYQRLNNWKSADFAHTMLCNQRPVTPPVFKHSDNEQLHLDFNLRAGNYNRSSLPGEMMQPLPRCGAGAIHQQSCA